MEILILPRWLLNRLPIDDRGRKSLNASLSALLVALSVPILLKIPHHCLFQRYLGIPCPGCGVTHSLAAIEQMQLWAAWQWNPAGVALAIYLMFQICVRPQTTWFPGAEAAILKSSKLGERLVLSALLAEWLIRLLHF